MTAALVSCFSLATLAVVELCVFLGFPVFFQNLGNRSMYKIQLVSSRDKPASDKAKGKPMNEALVVELRLLVSLVDVNLIVHFKY